MTGLQVYRSESKFVADNYTTPYALVLSNLAAGTVLRPTRREPCAWILSTIRK